MNPRNYPNFPDGEADVPHAYDGLRDAVSTDVQNIVGTIPEIEIGTTPGTVAAGDDARLLDDNLFLSLTSLGSPVILSAAQCKARNIYLRGTLAGNTVVEFLATSRTWTVTDETTRGSFTLSLRKTGGTARPLYAGETVRFYSP